MHKPMNITTVTGDMLKPGDIVYDVHPTKKYAIKLLFVQYREIAGITVCLFRSLSGKKPYIEVDGFIPFSTNEKFYWEYPKD